MFGHDIIVIGASAGGVDALPRLIASLPVNLPASVFVVLHIPAQGPDLLPKIIRRTALLSVSHGVDGESVRKGRVYVAPPDHHLQIDGTRVRLSRGPRENFHRPSIDALFRSAAESYGPRVVGVVLTGNLDDGTAGLHAVKSAGGIAIVHVCSIIGGGSPYRKRQRRCYYCHKVNHSKEKNQAETGSDAAPLN